jgi:hypothetical protein
MDDWRRMSSGSIGNRRVAQEGSPMQNVPDVSPPLRSLILRTVYAICLLGATYNHWFAIYQHGLDWDYGGFPRASTTFWTALAFIDPAAVILLFMRPNAGIALTIAIIVSDVIHNIVIQALYFPPLLRTLATSPRMVEQIAFMAFVLATRPLAWARKTTGSGVRAFSF